MVNQDYRSEELRKVVAVLDVSVKTREHAKSFLLQLAKAREVSTHDQLTRSWANMAKAQITNVQVRACWYSYC